MSLLLYAGEFRQGLKLELRKLTFHVTLPQVSAASTGYTSAISSTNLSPCYSRLISVLGLEVVYVKRLLQIQMHSSFVSNCCVRVAAFRVAFLMALR